MTLEEDWHIAAIDEWLDEFLDTDTEAIYLEPTEEDQEIADMVCQTQNFKKFQADNEKSFQNLINL